MQILEGADARVPPGHEHQRGLVHDLTDMDQIQRGLALDGRGQEHGRELGLALGQTLGRTNIRPAGQDGRVDAALSIKPLFLGHR